MSKCLIYYKGTDADGLSFHKPDDGKRIKYTVGKTVRVPRKHLKDPPALCSESVLHACEKPNQLLIYNFPQRVYEVQGEPVIKDDTKSGFKELTVIHEVPEEEHNSLFGWNIVECRNPVNPLKMSPVVTEEDKVLLRKWAQVWDQVGDQVRDQVWAQVRDQVGDQVRDQVWAQVRDQVRDQVWAQVWAYIGDLFHSPEHPWIHHDLAQLWRRGLVFTEVNGEWQLRGGPKMKVLSTSISKEEIKIE